MINISAFKKAMKKQLKAGALLFWGRVDGKHAFGGSHFLITLDDELMSNEIRAALLTSGLSEGTTSTGGPVPSSLHQLVKAIEDAQQDLPVMSDTKLTYSVEKLNLCVFANLKNNEWDHVFVDQDYVDVFGRDSAYRAKSSGMNPAYVGSIGIIMSYKISPESDVWNYLRKDAK